jgi:drug/metabolite transporter (DMT)-like permease
VALGAFSAVSHLLSIAAFRFADASTLAPLVYVELIGAAFIGYFVFSEVPGTSTIVGAALIVAAGLVLLKRDRAATRLKSSHAVSRSALRSADDS